MASSGQALAILDMVGLEIGVETEALRGAHGCDGGLLGMKSCCDGQGGVCIYSNIPADSRDKLAVGWALS